MNKQANILIVIPRFVKNVGDGYLFPMGIPYISAALKQAGFHVASINLNHCAGDISELVQKAILQNSSNILCTGGLSMHYNMLKKIFRAGKQVDSKLITIAGGGLITAEPEIAMEALEIVDFGIIGEGEITVCELIERLQAGSSDFSTIPGIIFKEKERWRRTIPRSPIENLDALPLPDYEAMELNIYSKLPSNYTGDKFYTLIASRSCPFQCTFCFHTLGNKYRARSIQSIISEINYLITHYNIRFIYISDDLFGHNKKRVEEFCNFTKTLEHFHWRANFRVSEIDEEMVTLLKEGKCSIVALGLESADDRILKSMKKSITVAQIERALDLLYKAGITIEGNFIFGDRAETIETATYTLDWWEAHRQYNINMLWIGTYPGTELYRYACQKGIIADRIKFLQDICPSVNVSQLSSQELAQIALRMMQLPFSGMNRVSNIKLQRIDHLTARIDIEGACSVCGHVNEWKERKLFTYGDIGMACSSCGKKHTIQIPSEIVGIFVRRLQKLLEKYQSVALWGITYCTFDFFQQDSIFLRSDIIFIDSNHAKQAITFQGKKVYPPNILSSGTIPIVINFYPGWLQDIQFMVEELYPKVNNVIDAADFICNPRYQD